MTAVTVHSNKIPWTEVTDNLELSYGKNPHGLFGQPFLLPIRRSSLEKCLARSSAHFAIQLFGCFIDCFLLLSRLSSVGTLGTSP